MTLRDVLGYDVFTTVYVPATGHNDTPGRPGL